MSKFIVIVGCGRLGASLAGELSREGHSVVAIDKRENAFSSLPSDYSGFKVQGDASQHSVMKSAGANRADIFIAVTSEDDLNLMAAQVASEVFGVPIVMARVFDPEKQKAYADLRIRTICPTAVAANLFLEALQFLEALEEAGAKQ